MNDPQTTTVDWEYPKIGTCGEPCDILRVSLLRTRCVPDLLLKFDGQRDGWVIGGSFRTADGNDFVFKEGAFISASDLDEDCDCNAFRDNDYAYATIEDYEFIIGSSVNDAFRTGWIMARITNHMLKQLNRKDGE